VQKKTKPGDYLGPEERGLPGAPDNNSNSGKPIILCPRNLCVQKKTEPGDYLRPEERGLPAAEPDSLEQSNDNNSKPR